MSNLLPDKILPAMSDKNAESVQAPILWTLLALAYLCEIGAISVIINTHDMVQTIAAIWAMIFPLLMIVFVLLVRRWKEYLFYISIDRMKQIQGIDGTADINADLQKVLEINAEK